MRTVSEIDRAMHDYLPLYYADISVADNVIAQEAAEVAALNTAIYDVLDQFYVDTATWGLARWERIFGIATDEAKPIEQRRSVIKSRMRGAGTATRALIDTVAEAYDNGEVEVTEYATNLLRNGNGETGDLSSWVLGNVTSTGTYGTNANISALWVDDHFEITGNVTSSLDMTQIIKVTSGKTYTIGANKTTPDGRMSMGLYWYSDLPIFNDAANTSKYLSANIVGTSAAGFVGVRKGTYVAPEGANYAIFCVICTDPSTTISVNEIRVNVGAELLPYESKKDYTVGITFVSAMGVPPNIADIQKAIRDILPAHLEVDFVFRFYSYAELITSGRAYSELLAITYDELYNQGGVS